MKNKTTYYYHYCDRITGEYFSVCATSVEESSLIAQQNFKSPMLCGRIDEEVAEMLGEDVY